FFERGDGISLSGQFFDRPAPQLRTMRLQGGQMFEHRFIGNYDIDIGVVQDMNDLVGFEEVVDGNEHPSGAKHTEEGGDELGTILQPKTNALAAFYAQSGRENSRHEVGLGQEQAVVVLVLSPENGRLGSMTFSAA